MRFAFHVVLLQLLAGTALAAPFDLQFMDVDGRPVAGAVVTLRSSDLARPPAKAIAGVIDQLQLQFVPHVLVVPRGSTVAFPNSDTVSHQIYSFSPAKRFKLPLYRGKPHEPQMFDLGGVVTLGCNIHDQMRAYVYVIEGQYYGRTDANGRWSAGDVQPGQYQATIWHPLSRTPGPVLEQPVMVGAAPAPMLLRATRKLSLRSTSQVPANWNAY
jgi:plastocyanin